MRVIMAGDKVHVFLNGQLVVNGVTLENHWQRDLRLLPFGPIESQAHKSVVWFKHRYVRELISAKRCGQSDVVSCVGRKMRH